ncbi:cytochrome c [Granulicella sp. dw_53]|uniref:c-type cytochrome n=1 Tax=Granulicella sp. dw_53 TaxID=2719792 RepID=UPI001BD38479|nr:cytochrome c [Granulicella sp. dw_53]
MSFPLIATVLMTTLFAIDSSSGAQSPAANPYAAKCQMCHGATGLGDTPAGKAMGARPFNSPEVIKESDADLLATIKNGKAKMPAFAGKLTDSDMTVLVAYIRKLQK